MLYLCAISTANLRTLNIALRIRMNESDRQQVSPVDLVNCRVKVADDDIERRCKLRLIDWWVPAFMGWVTAPLCTALPDEGKRPRIERHGRDQCATGKIIEKKIAGIIRVSWFRDRV